MVFGYQILVIIDASTLLDGLRCVEANYPERIKKMVFLNGMGISNS